MKTWEDSGDHDEWTNLDLIFAGFQPAWKQDGELMRDKGQKSAVSQKRKGWILPWCWWHFHMFDTLHNRLQVTVPLWSEGPGPYRWNVHGSSQGFYMRDVFMLELMNILFFDSFRFIELLFIKWFSNGTFQIEPYDIPSSICRPPVSFLDHFLNNLVPLWFNHLVNITLSPCHLLNELHDIHFPEQPYNHLFSITPILSLLVAFSQLLYVS